MNASVSKFMTFTWAPLAEVCDEPHSPSAWVRTQGKIVTPRLTRS
jgi:hypothetical protein